MQVYQDKFFKNIQAEVCVLLNMDSVLGKLKSIKMLNKIRNTFSKVMELELKSCISKRNLNLNTLNNQKSQLDITKFKINSNTFVFKENLKFICMYISKIYLKFLNSYKSFKV